MSNKIDDGLTNQQRYYRKNITESRRRTRERVAEWRKTHPNLAKQSVRESYQRHREKRLAAKREHYQRVRKLQDATPEGRAKDRAKKEARRARIAGVPATLTEQEWQTILAAHSFRCAYCGGEGPLEQDHVVPLTKGGAHSADNVVPACKPCNSSKGNRSHRPIHRAKVSGECKVEPEVEPADA